MMTISTGALEECIDLRAQRRLIAQGTLSHIPSIGVIRALLASAGPNDMAALGALKSRAGGDAEVVACIDEMLAALAANEAQLALSQAQGTLWWWEWAAMPTPHPVKGTTTVMVLTLRS